MVRVIDLTTLEMKYLSGIDMEISICYKRDKLKVTDTFLSSTDQNFLTLFFWKEIAYFPNKALC